MITLLTILLILLAAVILAVIAAMLAGDDRDTTQAADRDADPAPLPPARPAAELLVGAHAAPVGSAQVPAPGTTIAPPAPTPPPAPYASRHGAESAPAPWFTRPDLYSPAFAAQVGIDPAPVATPQRPDHGHGSLPHDRIPGTCEPRCDDRPCPADLDHPRCVEACLTATTDGATR